MNSVYEETFLKVTCILRFNNTIWQTSIRKCTILATSAVAAQHCRYFHLTSHNNNIISRKRLIKSPVDDLGEWIPIYRFPYIVHCRIFARAKLHMTVMMTTIMPVSYFLYSDSYNSSDLAIIGGISLFSLALIYGFGQIFRRLIGSIYVLPDKNLVRISHLTFFGNRCEKIIPRDDLLLLSDSNANLNELLLLVSQLNNHNEWKDSLYICLKFGGILDVEKFTNIFGNIE
ncbi:hypothetical protein BLA29_008108 [Euroglyphus maynei]|uniref:Transmembrane protein 186 n=1 Tax=Euroglyphus maynei TaxID=6958 RepID=A0A1Y3AKP3_EURMA|nr:hypothetical protein BLA29_008108 [Euroglyphus maynei]